MAMFGSSWTEDEEESLGGMMFGPKKGSWSLYSKTDSRWNCSGRGYVGGGVMPTEIEAKLKELKKTLGEPPKDLGWSYMKD